MRRLILLLLVAASMLAQPGPARAQATADQLNRLSLEALTAPPAGGGGGYSRRTPRSYGYRAARTRRSSYRRGSYRSVVRSSDRRGVRRYAGSYRPARSYGARRYAARSFHHSARYAPRVYRSPRRY